MRRLSHFTSAEHALSAVALQRLKIARISELNDPFELIPAALGKKTHRRALENLRDALSKDKGLLCFSEKWDHPLMWSHYASRHRGMCLVFELADQFIDRVKYSRQRLQIEWEDEGAGKVTQSFMKSLLMTKADYWSYESEYRAFLQLDETTMEHGFYYYPFDSKMVLVEVIRGPLCELPAEPLKRLVSSVGPHVNVVETRLAAKTFRIIKK
jgi:hypothetical protein